MGVGSHENFCVSRNADQGTPQAYPALDFGLSLNTGDETLAMNSLQDSNPALKP